MTKEQAAQILLQAITSMQLTFKDHQMLQNALNVLIKEKEEIKKDN